MFAALYGSASQSVGVRRVLTAEFVTGLEIGCRFFAEIKAQIGLYSCPGLFAILVAAEVSLPGTVACHRQSVAGPVAGERAAYARRQIVASGRAAGIRLFFRIDRLADRRPQQECTEPDAGRLSGLGRYPWIFAAVHRRLIGVFGVGIGLARVVLLFVNRVTGIVGRTPELWCGRSRGLNRACAHPSIRRQRG
ncbi:hypothetical protein D3C86_1303760 [compost metagenome]